MTQRTYVVTQVDSSVAWGYIWGSPCTTRRKSRSHEVELDTVTGDSVLVCRRTKAPRHKVGDILTIIQTAPRGALQLGPDY